MPTDYLEQYSPSVNIVRDADKELLYYPTENARKVAKQIVGNFKQGVRSFTLIGSYGTGKSSFIWALQKSILKEKDYYEADLIEGAEVNIINIVGEYRSLIEAFEKELGLSNNNGDVKAILTTLFKRYDAISTAKSLLLISVDEFGKFLEYAVKNNPEKELYFIQQLTEFVNNSNYNICLLTAIHQDFSAYAQELSSQQQQEWTKVKGRFKEVTFNEPIEQLLYLAAQHIQQQGKGVPAPLAKKLSKLIEETHVFRKTDSTIHETLSQLLPIDGLAAYVLTSALQKYGQNERSLFSFLQSQDHTSIRSFTPSKTEPIYSLAHVYDYLVFNFFAFLNSRNNPHFIVWVGIREALEDAEIRYNNDSHYLALLKTIGLLSLYAPKGSAIDHNFIDSYAKLCLNIDNALVSVENLLDAKLIFYRNYHRRFVISRGTDLDIQGAIAEAGSKVQVAYDIADELSAHFQFLPIQAKAYSYKNGTPRFFQFRITDRPLIDIPKDEIDGFINLILDENIPIETVQKTSREQGEAILYGYYENTKRIREQLTEIKKVSLVKQENDEDSVALIELKGILQHNEELLSHYVLDGFYNYDVKWFFKGNEVDLKSSRHLNQTLSIICEDVYPATPIFNNELVNRHRISSSIHTAKKRYFENLTTNWNEENIGFEDDKFPPEKTIYLSLIKENGTDLINDAKITEGSFAKLWEFSEKFLADSKQGKRNISELFEKLSVRPFKLKQGFADFWVGTFLFLKHNDYALFSNGNYVPNLSANVIGLLLKKPQEYEIKAFDVEGLKLNVFNSYRYFLNQESNEKVSNQAFIETIKPFLTFYANLPEFAKNTRSLSKEAITLRNAIELSKDPEKTFFEDFPNALGTSVENLSKDQQTLENYTVNLERFVTEIRTVKDRLQDRFDNFMQHQITGDKAEFETYQTQIQNRFKSLKANSLPAKYQVFLSRINSKLDVKGAWLSSVAQALVGKPLDNFNDEDEDKLYRNFKNILVDLDSQSELSEVKINKDEEKVLSVAIHALGEDSKRRIIRIPKQAEIIVRKTEDDLKKKLSKDKSANIIALTNLLNNLLTNEES
jgi:hypothetical protein